jgi:3-hydroxyacyl-[acyl-carrier-protein] dehydratase
MVLGIDYIKKIQRNRFPLLFIDQVIELTEGSKSICKKNFSMNEWIFRDAIRNKVASAAVISEAMTQAFLIAILSRNDLNGRRTSLHSIVDFEYTNDITVGDEIYFNATVNSYYRGVVKGEVLGYKNKARISYQKVTIVIPEIFDDYMVALDL